MFRYRHACRGLLALAGGVLLMPSTARAVDPKLLPGNTEWIFSLNIKQIVGSELVKANKDAIDVLWALARMNLPADEGLEKFLESAGFDMGKDLHAIALAGPAGVDADKLLILVEGKFNQTKVHAAAAAAAKEAGDTVKISKSGGVKIYEVSLPGEKTLFLSLLDDKTLAATAAKEPLIDTIARAAGKKAGLKKEFKALMESVSDKQSLNFAATSAAIMKIIQNAPNIPRPDEVAAALGDVEGLAAAITLKKDIEFQLAVSTKDAETAKNISQGAQFAIGAMKAMMQKKADGGDAKMQIANDVLKTLKVDNRGSNVIIRGEVTIDVIDRIFKSLTP